ncbi:hypothetical protein A2U01_0082289, partial [Trifolium medium]|nr:hypothetical protein [Trifolium medium]
MRTVSREDSLKYLARIRQQKAEKPEDNIDPLSQLAIEEEGAKGKRKKKTDPTRIIIPIPHKGDSSVAGGGVEEAL